MNVQSATGGRVHTASKSGTVGGLDPIQPACGYVNTAGKAGRTVFVPVEAEVDCKKCLRDLQNAGPAPAATPEPKAKAAPRTFDGNAVTEHECATCHTVKKVNAFPTVTGKGATGTGKRGVECRACRDARTKAAKATANAA